MSETAKAEGTTSDHRQRRKELIYCMTCYGQVP